MSQQNLQKFKFRIIDFSSEEAEYSAQELLIQSPSCKGWHTAKFCDYPQQMTIQFMNPVILKQVQILSHQSKISSKIEIYTYLPDSQSNSIKQEIKFKKLGYLNLDTNEKTGYQSRELRSVFIDNPCLYIKFIFHKHHVNKFNLFNQIGIIALSCFGEYIQQQNQIKNSEPVKLFGTINSCIGQNQLRPLLEGIPQQQMDLIGEAIGNSEMDMQLKKEQPKQETITKIKNTKTEDKGKICEFCDKMDKKFFDQNKMDIHLWKECPWLIICEGCSQVVEIPSYAKHLLEECDNKKLFKKCPRCKEPVHNSLFKQHCDLMKCFIPQQQTNRCPLCLQDIGAGIQGWKTHLISESCPANNRR